MFKLVPTRSRLVLGHVHRSTDGVRVTAEAFWDESDELGFLLLVPNRRRRDGDFPLDSVDCDHMRLDRIRNRFEYERVNLEDWFWFSVRTPEHSQSDQDAQAQIHD